MTVQELRKEYTQITGKKNATFLNEEQLKGAISQAKDHMPSVKAWEDMTEEERVYEAKRINSMEIHTVPEEPTLVMLTDKITREPLPMAIVNNKYIPFGEAMILYKKNQIQRLQHEITTLELK